MGLSKTGLGDTGGHLFFFFQVDERVKLILILTVYVQKKTTVT